jgi:hypothetical protein
MRPCPDPRHNVPPYLLSRQAHSFAFSSEPDSVRAQSGDGVSLMSSWVVAIATVVLVIVTAWYARLTKRLVEAQTREGLLSDAPVLGIKVVGISLSRLWDAERNRRSLTVRVNVENIGAGPALEVGIDSCLELEYVDCGGEHSIPARFEQAVIPHLKPGEHAKGRRAEQHFGGDAVDALLENVREEDRLNMVRIATRAPGHALSGTKLSVITTYRNVRGQWYGARLTVPLSLSAERIIMSPEQPEPRYPGPEDTDELLILAFPRAVYVAEPLSSDQVDKVRHQRDERRKYSGW